MQTPLQQKRQSMSTQVKLGLGVIILSLAVVSALSLFAYFTLSQGLDFLNQESVPRIVRGTAISKRMNDLLISTERLISATSEPMRRSAYADSISTLEDLQATVQDTTSSNTTVQRQLLVLKETIAELNDIVVARIDITARSRAAIFALITYSDDVNDMVSAFLSSGKEPADIASIQRWRATAVGIQELAGQALTVKTRFKAKRLEKTLEKEFRTLDQDTANLPADMRREVEKATQRLRDLFLGASGLLPLKITEIDITMQHSGRGNFSRSLVDDTTSTLVTSFNLELTNISERAESITSQGNRLAILFAVATVGTFLLSVAVTIYFQRMVVERIVNLNASILARIGGQKSSITADGNDEITDITQSFLFFENEVNRRERELSALAMKDALTGTWNRRKFIESGKDLARLANRYDHPLVLMMMDIDHFKSINDTFGHGVGDTVLRNVALLCLEGSRDVDIFARIGGEEFATLLPETNIDDALLVAERTRAKIEKQIWSINGDSVTCTVSIGLATLDKSDDGQMENLESLMSRADKALYEAKQQGRNRVRAA